MEHFYKNNKAVFQPVLQLKELTYSTLRTRFLITFVLLAHLSIFFIGCKKSLEVDAPTTNLNSENVYATDATAISVLTGLYAKMGKDGFGITGNQSISELVGLSSDEFALFASSNQFQRYYSNNLTESASAGSVGSEFWSALYGFIYPCNAAIEGLTNSSRLSPAVKQQLLGEAKFMRAFYYFYLVNLYGDVPLVLSTDATVNSSLARAPKVAVYDQIVQDLTSAQDLLSEFFLNGSLQKYSGSEERVRPSKWAATALLARVYLFKGDWTNANVQSSTIINSSIFTLSSLNRAFLKASSGNREAVWQLQPVVSGHNTEDGWYFVLPSTGPSNDSYHPVYLSRRLLNSFEAGDLRRLNRNWIDSVIVGADTFFFPAKYKSATYGDPVNEYLMVLRLSEQYLIRAEALAHLGNVPSAQSDLNAIRNRAGLPNTTANDQTSLYAAILHERQTELFTEWGHRWLDLKRTGNIDAVMTIVTQQKGSAWQSFQQLYPIPFSDIQKNQNLTQNQGY